VAEDDERHLLERCLAGDEDACARLVDAHARMVGTVIWRATGDHEIVEDLAQDTFLRVFRALHAFDRRAKLSTWIYTIAHRVAIDHLRKAGRWREEGFVVSAGDEAAVAVETLPASPLASPEAVFVRDEDVRRVREALARLPAKYRVPLVYAAIDGLDYPTIAVMLGVTVGGVKTLVFRAKRMLKDEISDEA
jgi:RNA polymerase sigma-70 factor (ECF subfamily)